MALFLFFTAVLIGWFIWPRIPELIPSREDLGEFLLDINQERDLSPLLRPRNQKLISLSYG